MRLLFIVGVCTSILAGCGVKETNNTPISDETQFYNLGREQAVILLQQCKTTSAVRDKLIDIRAREYDIRTHNSDKAANAFINGFEVCLKESGDTLHSTLFM